MTSLFAKWIKHTPPALAASDMCADPWVNCKYLQREFHPQKATFSPVLKLNVAHEGVVFMNPPEEARVHAQMNGTEPVYDYMLTGYLEVEPPASHPRFRCRAIRVRIQAIIKPDKPGSVVKPGTLFEREVKIAEDDDNGILIEGKQRFDFSLILSSTMPQRDWGEWGCIVDDVMAILEGVPIYQPTNSPFPNPAISSSSPALLSLAKKRAPSKDDMSISTTSTVSSAGSSGDAPWLEGKHQVELTIRLIYNPDPTGGVSTLNETSQGIAAGLGEYDIRLYSDVWTIASLLRASIAIMDIPSTTTIFNIVIYIAQTTVVSLSKDDPSDTRTFTRRFLIAERGKAVDRQIVHPDATQPAMWRGKGAGGKDDGELILEMHGRVGENDFVLRPSTMPSVETPARNSHAIEVAVFFSSWGEDAYGKPMPVPGPGGLRLLKVRKPVMLPCCAVIPSIVRLPGYADPEELPTPESSHLYMVCSCRMTMEEIQARMREAIVQEEKAAEQAAQRAAHMKDLERASTYQRTEVH